MITPKYYSIVSGSGESEYELVAFDKALMDAGIGDYNLVQVSSIIPPCCEYRNVIDLVKGSILYAAYAKKTVRDGEVGSTAVAVAFPKNDAENGVIFETSANGNDAEVRVKGMCTEAMQNRQREIKDIHSSSIILHGKNGLYTCGISAVVMW